MAEISAIAVILLASISAVFCGNGDDWGYSADNGPENWEGNCQDGIRQSPIDIRPSSVDYALLHRMHFMHYDHSGSIQIQNNGHTVVANGFSSWQTKQPYIQGGGLKHKYKLAQFHLHWSQHDHTGSEHKIAGLHYPAELHLVHVRADLEITEALKRPDGLAVVGVFLYVDNDSSPMSSVASVLESITQPGNKTAVHGFRARSVLPAQTEAFYRYDGSLTTPGCDESVIWTVLAEPVSITRAQDSTGVLCNPNSLPKQKVYETFQIDLRKLREIQEKDGLLKHNYRPTYPMNGRRVLYRPNSFDKTLLCSQSGSISFLTVVSFVIYRFF